MSHIDKPTIDKLINDQTNLLERCEKAGLHWAVLKMSEAIDTLRAIQGTPLDKR